MFKTGKNGSAKSQQAVFPPRFLSLSPCPDFPPWWIVTWKCNPNQPFPSLSCLLVMVFIRATKWNWCRTAWIVQNRQSVQTESRCVHQGYGVRRWRVSLSRDSLSRWKSYKIRWGDGCITTNELYFSPFSSVHVCTGVGAFMHIPCRVRGWCQQSPCITLQPYSLSKVSPPNAELAACSGDPTSTFGGWNSRRAYARVLEILPTVLILGWHMFLPQSHPQPLFI